MKMRSLIIGLLLFAIGATAQAAVYVKWNAPGCGNGNSWATAYRTIQEAVNDPRTDTEPVYVAGATRQQQKADPAAGVYAKVVLLPNVKIYGGYEGAGDPGNRDAKKWISTIRFGQPGAAVTAANNTVIDGFRIITAANGIDVSSMSGVAITGNEIIGEGAGDTFGVYCITSAANIEISANRITKCIAGTYLESVSGLVVKKNCVTANRLAGIYAGSSQVSIEQNYVASNCIEADNVYSSTYREFFGGVFLVSCGGAVHCNIIAGNQDAGLYLDGSGVSIINNTIVQNAAGIYGAGSDVRNNIIAYNNTGVVTSGIQGYSNNVFGNGSGYSAGSAANGNIAQDPQFVDLEHGDLRLKPTSPCRDSGTVRTTPVCTIDFDGHPRIWPIDGKIDMGAYEYDGAFDPQYHRVYVNAASLGGDGSSWEQAFTTIADGLAAAECTGGEVWVAKGLYSENIVVSPFVQLLGGFNGNEANLCDRPAPFSRASESIIDGSGKSSVVIMNGQSVLDGFTVRNGIGYLQPNTYGKPTYGGGVFCGTASPIIRNNTITANGSTTGGGICCLAKSTATITNNRIIANRASDGGGIACKFSSSVTISSNRISGNSAGKYVPFGSSGTGGALCIHQSNAKILGNVITGNDAGFHSFGVGGIYNRGGSVVVANNLIAANGGCSQGSAVCFDSGNGSSLVNNTIVGNNNGLATASAGAWDVVFVGTSTGTVSNNIIAFNSGGIRFLSPVTVKNNDVYGNCEQNYYGIADPTGINGNISQDPRLTNWSLGQVNLTPVSPCKNAGDGSVVQPDWVDAGGNPRVLDGTVDMGAYEFSSAQINQPSGIVIRVSPNGNDYNDGLSWDKAKRTIQTAIEAVSVVGGEVWVSTGTYNENIQLRPYAHLLGGFTGTETASYQRDWNANRTIIDGCLKGSVVTITHGGIPGTLLSSIDGFTIQNGTGTVSPVYGDLWGGGIFCQFASTRISHCLVINNGAPNNGLYQCGTGICCLDGAIPTITSNVIARNGTKGGYGLYAIHCSYVVGGTIANNVISNNGTGNMGTGILVDYASIKVTNNIVTGSGYGILWSPVAVQQIPSVAVLANNDSYGNQFNYSPYTNYTGNYSFDPMFKDPANGDYHLKPGSPCIDAGNSTYYADSDMSGSICPQDGNGDGTAIPDIGIYETPLGLSALKKNYPDGSLVVFGGAAVTARFPDGIYVESLDRSGGIRVSTAENPAVGSVVNVMGSLFKDAITGEVYVGANCGWPKSTGATAGISPLGLNIAALGGGKLGLQDAVWGMAQVADPRGVVYFADREAKGLNNIGLLVRTSGRVTSLGYDGKSFYMSDGSNIYADTRTKGIKVDTTGLAVNLTVGQSVVVTGISSCEKVCGSQPLRRIRVRSSADIQPL